MKNILLTAICSMLLMNVNAQHEWPFKNNYTTATTEIGIDANGLIGSDAITTKFMNTYINNEFIEQSVKDGAYTKMDDRSKIGSYLNAGAYMKKMRLFEADSTVRNLTLALRYRTHFNADFPSDLFALYFYGNKRFAGVNADISDFNYEAIQYQQLQFGYGKTKKSGNSEFEYYAGISFLNGQSYLDISTTRGSIYTQPDGEYADLDIRLESRQSDTTKSNFGSSNGLGASLDLMVSYKMENQVKISLSATDIGMIAWNSKSSYFVVDTTYRFEGLTVNNLFDSLYLDITSEAEFIDGFKEDRKKESFTSVLPAKFQLQVSKPFMEDKLMAYASVNYFLNADYTPQIIAGGSYFFSKSFMAGVSAGFGGYTEFSAGIHVGADLGHGFILTAGTDYLTGLINQDNSTAEGGVGSLRFVF
ncbi:MAG: hypothetical protein IPN13_23020 [Bacteroidetes bacterium]|nr:hypothetical protein [Bacteroidota bacterium]